MEHSTFIRLLAQLFLAEAVQKELDVILNLQEADEESHNSAERDSSVALLPQNDTFWIFWTTSRE